MPSLAVTLVLVSQPLWSLSGASPFELSWSHSLSHLFGGLHLEYDLGFQG